MKGNALLIVISIVAVLSLVGFGLVFTMTSEFNMVGDERRRMQLDEVAMAAFADLMACEKNSKRKKTLLPQVGESPYEGKRSPCEEEGVLMDFQNEFGDKYCYRYNANFIRDAFASGESLIATKAYTYKVSVFICDSSNSDCCCSFGEGCSTTSSLIYLKMRFNKLGGNAQGYTGGDESLTESD